MSVSDPKRTFGGKASPSSVEDVNRLERHVTQHVSGPLVIHMAKRDRIKTVQLEALNAQLTESLARCREILAECRAKLAANRNHPDEAEHRDRVRHF
jgi:hypothetical protein